MQAMCVYIPHAPKTAICHLSYSIQLRHEESVRAVGSLYGSEWWNNQMSEAAVRDLCLDTKHRH